MGGGVCEKHKTGMYGPNCKECDKEIICHKCGGELNNLMYNSKVEVSQVFSLNNGVGDYEAMDNYGNHSDDNYTCPHCSRTLATSEEDAIRILREQNIGVDESKIEVNDNE